MNKLFTKIATAFVGVAMAVGVGVAIGNNSSVREARATDGYNSVYTLDTTASGVTTTSNNYGTAGTATVSAVGWSFTGNGQMNPWRLGGKSISKTDRPFYTTSAISGSVDRIEVTFGTASSITVNSFTVSVHTSAAGASNGTGAVETFTPTFAASSTVGVDLASTRTGCFYRFVMNVTVSVNSNKFVQVSKVDFLQTSKTLSSITASLTDSSATWYVGDTVTASDLTVTPHYSDGTDGTPITDGTGVTVTNGTLASVGANTVNVSYDGKSTTVSVTAQAARTMTGIALHGTIEKDEYYVGETWDLAGLDIQINWSSGDPTYIDLDDDDVAYECTPNTATSTSVTEFDIEVMYDEFDETFTVDGLTVSERPLADILNQSVIPSAAVGSNTSSWGTATTFSDYTGAVYTGRFMGPSDSSTYIGRLNNSTNGYIYTSTLPSGMKLKSIEISAIAENKSVGIYAQNTAYTAAPSSGNIATLTPDSLSYDFEADYKAICIRGLASSCDIGVVTITYESAAPKVTLSQSSVEVGAGAENTQVTVSTDNFSGTPTITASTESTLFDIEYDSTNEYIYILAGSNTGSATATITGTYSSETATATLTVTIVQSRTFVSLVITNNSDDIEFNEDNPFTVSGLEVTANFTEGGSPLTTVFSEENSNLDQLDFTVGGNSINIGDSLTVTGTLAVVISYTDIVSGTTRSTESYNITVNAYVAHTWTKVTTAPADWRGTYLLVYEDDTDAYIFNSSLATTDVANNYVSGTISSNTITGSKAIDAVAIQIERDDVTIDSVKQSMYYIKEANGKYLVGTASKMNNQASAGTSNYVTFDGVTPVINNNTVRFNTASDQMRFRVYTSTSTLPTAVLYKMDVTTSITSEVSSFVSGFHTALGSSVCKTDGTTDVSAVNTAWTSQATAFAALSVDAQGILANTTYTHNAETSGSTADIVDRYDYIYSRYSESLTKGDFMNRRGLASYQATGTLNSKITLLNIVSNNGTSISIIVIVSLVSLTAIGGYFLLRKKKED